MEADEPKKNLSKSVSLPPDMWDRVESRAAARYGGNRSSYAEADGPHLMVAEPQAPYEVKTKPRRLPPAPGKTG